MQKFAVLGVDLRDILSRANFIPPQQQLLAHGGKVMNNPLHQFQYLSDTAFETLGLRDFINLQMNQGLVRIVIFNDQTLTFRANDTQQTLLHFRQHQTLLRQLDPNGIKQKGHIRRDHFQHRLLRLIAIFCQGRIKDSNNRPLATKLPIEIPAGTNRCDYALPILVEQLAQGCLRVVKAREASQTFILRLFLNSSLKGSIERRLCLNVRDSHGIVPSCDVAKHNSRRSSGRIGKAAFLC